MVGILWFQIMIKDVWKEYTGWPLNDMERQYKFMVKHVQLWKVAFHSTSPKWIHSMYLAAIAAFYAKYVTQYLQILMLLVLSSFCVTLNLLQVFGNVIYQCPNAAVF